MNRQFTEVSIVEHDHDVDPMLTPNHYGWNYCVVCQFPISNYDGQWVHYDGQRLRS